MKNLLNTNILLIASCIFGCFSVRAQTTTANVTLQVTLQNTSSITIGTGFQTAALTYATPADFTGGKTLTQPAALTAVSNTPYSITVVSGSDLVFQGAEVPGTGVTRTDIPVTDVNVTPAVNGGSATGVTITGINIPKTTAGTIIKSTTGTTGQQYDLTYSTTAAPKADFLNKLHGTYQATLTYTITNP